MLTVGASVNDLRTVQVHEIAGLRIEERTGVVGGRLVRALWEPRLVKNVAWDDEAFPRDEVLLPALDAFVHCCQMN